MEKAWGGLVAHQAKDPPPSLSTFPHYTGRCHSPWLEALESKAWGKEGTVGIHSDLGLGLES